ncbi:MAG: hypothetical protein NC394_00780 [Bacteroides sp.]|nr:hypothetical protein [Bacteroides sp.]
MGMKQLQTITDIFSVCNTAKNTIYFCTDKEPNKRFISKPNRIVYWFAHTEGGLPLAEKMKALYEASFNNSVDFYIELLTG